MMGLNYLIHEETKRSNLVREAETMRHNVVGERIDFGQLGETVRSNLVKERISQGSLDESVRSNMARESLTARQLTESERSNRVHEQIGWGQLAETTRSNKAKEGISTMSLFETFRHNTTTERQARNELKSLDEYREAGIAKDYWTTNINSLTKTDPYTSAFLTSQSIAASTGTSPYAMASLVGLGQARSSFDTLSKDLIGWITKGVGKKKK